MTTLSTLDNIGGAAQTGGWTRPLLTTKTLPPFTQAGTLVVSAVGAGGGGAAASGSAPTTKSATGGNSAPWGRKKITIAIGDVIEWTAGATGAKAALAESNGSAGGTSTLKLNGVTILTVPGGEGGVYVASGVATPPTPVAAVTGADLAVLGIQAGTTQATTTNSAGGGAAVDILQTGLGRSPNVLNATNGVGGSIATDAGGLPPAPWTVLAEWGIVITDGNSASSNVGAPGRGGDGSVRGGYFAGGAANAPARGPGYGGGGGAGAIVANASDGGAPYAFLSFTPAD